MVIFFHICGLTVKSFAHWKELMDSIAKQNRTQIQWQEVGVHSRCRSANKTQPIGTVRPMRFIRSFATIFTQSRKSRFHWQWSQEAKKSPLKLFPKRITLVYKEDKNKTKSKGIKLNQATEDVSDYLLLQTPLCTKVAIAKTAIWVLSRFKRNAGTITDEKKCPLCPVYIPLQLSLAVICMSYTANEGWMAENADGTVTFLY